MFPTALTSFHQFITTLGPLWVAAVGAEFLTVFAESWGSLRVKDVEDEDKRPGFGRFVAGAAAVTAPLVLFTHGVFVTIALSPTLSLLAAGAVIGSVLVGSLLGWLFGAIAKPAAPTLRFLAAPLSFVAVVLALIAAWPSMPLIMHGLLLVFAHLVHP
ncbi:MAG: hypothetical protein ABUL55_00910 [Pseudomonadota bacterium]